MREGTSATSALLLKVLSRPLLALLKAGRYVAAELKGSYRPEKHYMRGPGPKWHEKATAIPARERRPDAAEPR